MATVLLVLVACSPAPPDPDATRAPGASVSAPARAEGGPSAGAGPGVDPSVGATPDGGAAAPAVLVGAGDIATCDSDADSATAALVQGTAGTVFTLGDNAYPDGTARDFARCYEPTWGRVKARTRPVIGNHDQHTPAAAGYFDYFAAAAGPRGTGYYSYEVGSWHVVVLNTNCASVPGGCRAGSAQQRWLSADLAASGARCTVAMAHHPLFTSAATHPPSTEIRPLVQALYDAGVEVLLAGHNHVYERFAPQTATGRADAARGIRQFVVGTGGAGLYPFGRPAPNSEVRANDTYGVLRLTLREQSYRWDFLPVPGGSFTDTGSGACH